MNTRVVGFRYTNEAVGALVLVAVLLFVIALVQAGRMREWFDPGTTIRVILPAGGLFGLKVGAPVEILGTKAGEVRRIILDPAQSIHAEIYVRKAMLGFVRRDSQAIIRKQFGVAGASYLELTRGSGAALDWAYAVFTATAERPPTDAMGELIAEIRQNVVPIVDDARVALQVLTALVVSLQDPQGRVQHLLTNLHAITEKIERGEGVVGRLLSDDTLVRGLETLLHQLNADVQRLEPILSALDTTARHAATVTATLDTYTGGLPQFSKRLQALQASLQAVLTDLSRTTPELPRLTRNLAKTTESLPLLVVQTEQSLDNLDKLLQQLRRHWLLGGQRSEAQQEPSRRLSVLEITP
jgi:phospholipid/cholesterol/gamma-HCH transport system substrate-binding protein